MPEPTILPPASHDPPRVSRHRTRLASVVFVIAGLSLFGGIAATRHTRGSEPPTEAARTDTVEPTNPAAVVTESLPLPLPAARQQQTESSVVVNGQSLAVPENGTSTTIIQDGTTTTSVEIESHTSDGTSQTNVQVQSHATSSGDATNGQEGGTERDDRNVR